MSRLTNSWFRRRSHSQCNQLPCWHGAGGSLVAAVLIVGCVATPEPAFDRHTLQLPLARVSEDSVIIDIGFLHVRRDDEFTDQIWKELDEQVLPPPLRRRLASNGLRVGLVSGRFPQVLRELIDERYASASSSWTGQSQQMDRGETNRRLHLRPGKRGEIVTADDREQLIVLCDQDGNVCGETFQEAQTMFAMEAHGNDDGSATLELVPQIQHGPSRSRFVGREGAFCLEAGRDRRVFDDLIIESRLLPGQTLVIGSVGPNRALGGCFFRHADGDPNVRKLLLVRVARSPGDKLFAHHSESEPVASPPDVNLP